ncbi:MAG: N-acetylmuramic acid 6-phosphate etherase [Actinomycetota bacterium]
MVQTTFEDCGGSMPDDLGRLATEQARAGFQDLDTRPTRELVELMNDSDATVAAAVRTAGGSITQAVDAVAARLAAGGRLVYIGAGTAARIAALDAVECAPTYGVSRETVVAVVAGGDAAFTNPDEGDEDDPAGAIAALQALHLCAADAVVSLSASGRTPYAVSAATYARSVGALVVGVVCNTDAALSAVVDIAIETPVGPEFIAGSTRLKSATAQKFVCNTLSTLVMVRLGRTYGGWMVGVQANNGKLRARARRILVEAAGISEEQAAALLEETGGDTRVALVMSLAGVSAGEAVNRLTASGGRVRDALVASD